LHYIFEFQEWQYASTLISKETTYLIDENT